MNPDKGPPALYRLNTERKYIHGTDKKVRQWTYGRRDRNKQNKVILMVGETGAGKTTMMNTMINYILGVKFEDQEFYQITDEEKHKDQSQSQTSEITVYEAFVEENPTSLTIIDTPGYGHSEGYEKDEEISKYLTRLFSDKDDGIHYIDAVCFVMKVFQNRLSDRQLYIFHSVLSLFGRNIEENIVFLLTQSDGGPPTDALNAINKAEIPCRRDEDNEPVHFLFNNRQKQKRDKKYNQGLRSAWGMGEESMTELLTLMDVKNRKSVEMTLDVLKERRRLEACVSNLKQRIEEKESKTTDELKQIQEILRQNRDKIKKCEDFQFTVKKFFKVKVPIVNEWPWNSKATCCFVCEENCHEWGCNWVSSDNLSWCEVMIASHCTVCTRKCHYSKHVKEDKKYVTKTEDVTMTFDELKKEYESKSVQNETDFDKEKYEKCEKEIEKCKNEIEENLKIVLEKTKQEKSKLLYEAYVSITSLSKIALKADSAFTLQHLDFLIPRLKEEEGKEEWMKNLQDLKKAGEEKKNKGALQYVMDRLQKLTAFFSHDKTS
ncbi:uncharacterized protein LOC120485489 [Pimephales promelas]|uniref:uncharacterized protein LOC120485489 n=1 Tax=Pimephales promelas TaxID=90988 RepID=UPI001955B9D0|nr:uncharacterized protein LOC120485489 [Pimephales promelas]